MGDTACTSSNESLKVDLRKWQHHTDLFVSMAHDYRSKSASEKVLLYMRCDMAREKMLRFIQSLQTQLIECTTTFEKSISEFRRCHEAEMAKRNESLLTKIQIAETFGAAIGSALQSDRQCAYDGRDLAKKCETFFETCFDLMEIDDFSYVDFVPQILLDLQPTDIGYIRFCDLSPSAVDIVAELNQDAVMKAFCHSEQMVLVHTNQEYNRDVPNHLQIRLVDPHGSNVRITIEDNGNGSYFVVFTPGVPGRYVLHVRLFGIDIKGSPMNIEAVLDVTTTSFPEIVASASLSTTASCSKVKQYDALVLPSDVSSHRVRLEKVNKFSGYHSGNINNNTNVPQIGLELAELEITSNDVVTLGPDGAKRRNDSDHLENILDIKTSKLSNISSLKDLHFCQSENESGDATSRRFMPRESVLSRSFPVEMHRGIGRGSRGGNSGLLSSLKSLPASDWSPNVIVEQGIPELLLEIPEIPDLDLGRRNQFCWCADSISYSILKLLSH